MAKRDINLSLAFGMAPKDAVSYFRSKGVAISDDWQDVWAAAHARAFTVAKATELDVLTAIRTAVDSAISEGWTAKQFRAQLTPTLQKLGWWGKRIVQDAPGIEREVQLGSPHRLNTIYQTNTQTAYMAGRYRRQLSRSNSHPYWQYIAIEDGRTRPAHSRLNGRVFRFDDPIWQSIYPPNGWGCRCRVRALSAAQVKALGLTVEDGAGYIQPIEAETVHRSTGEVERVPHVRIDLPDGSSMSPDLGWSYNPGSAAYGTDVAMARKLGHVGDADLRAQAIQSLNNAPLRQQQFSAWTAQALGKIDRFRQAQQRGDKLGMQQNGISAANKTVVAFLPDAIHQQLLRQGIDAGRVVQISERSLAHAHSEKHIELGTAVAITDYPQLAAMLSADATQVLWEPAKRELLFVVPQPDGRVIKIVVRPNDAKTQTDAVINLFKVSLQSIQTGINGGLYEVW